MAALDFKALRRPNLEDIMTTALQSFYSQLSQIYTLGCIAGVLDWDQKVMLPPLGAAGRSDQLELVSTLLHERMTDPKFLDCVDSLATEISALQGADKVNVREMKKQLDRARKLARHHLIGNADRLARLAIHR